MVKKPTAIEAFRMKASPFDPDAAANKLVCKIMDEMVTRVEEKAFHENEIKTKINTMRAKLRSSTRLPEGDS